MKHRLLLYHGISFGAAALVAALVAFFAPAWLHGMTRVVAAYDGAILVVLVWYWGFALRKSPEATKAQAVLEDPGRNLVLAIVLAAVAFGLFSAVVILGPGSRNTPPHHALAAYAAGIGAVVFGWLLIHTALVFHYARLFYRGADRSAGLIFPGNTSPSDWDFAYFSFVIGMTFQVSDVQISDPRIRRWVLFHGIISFAYNTAILALGVNVISNLLH